jgi:eukaryotic-like serine/threonine-protein kinase
MRPSAVSTLVLGPQTSGASVAVVSPDRFEDLGLVSVGGMGEIRRVQDRVLDRPLLLKVLKPELVSQAWQVEQFLREARLTAQLQHPSIVAVHELGLLPDGRLFFTMREVPGRTLTAVLAELARRSADLGEWATTADGGTLRRVVEVVRQVCLTVAFAHDRGVIHGDLKPDNVMVGPYGEVAVLDWGLASLADLEPVAASRVSGTPAYMAPEQAFAEPRTPATDVYALGATLYDVLAGHPPYPDPNPNDALRRLRRGDRPRPLHPIDDGLGFVETRRYEGRANGPREPGERTGPPIPSALAATVRRAMARDPRDRHPTALAVADDLAAWLEGSRRADDARALVAAALSQVRGVDDLRRRAGEARARAAALGDLPRCAPDIEKRATWALLDDAAALDAEADQCEVDLEGTLRGALTLAPGLPEAHAALAGRLEVLHRAAEAASDLRAARRLETPLRAHALALPHGHPARAPTLAYLKGDGAVTLLTEPPGATVQVLTHLPMDRRLIASPTMSLGASPVLEQRLGLGSYRLVVEGPAGPVCVPVAIDRCGRWDGVPPGGAAPLPIRLDVGLEDTACYVPAGWALLGDRDQDTRRIWVDGFVIDRFPVTNAQYLEYLDDVASRDEAEALRRVPRERTGTDEGRPVFVREAGRFRLGFDEDGDVFQPDWPVVLVDWCDARAYARWRAARTGRPWRLPSEWEWEKAARGVDGRRYPWGDHAEDTWACTVHAHARRPLLASVASFPVDESVYGVRQLAGNVHEWCAEPHGSPVPAAGTAAVLPGPSDAEVRIVRGGAWNNAISNARCDLRHGAPAISRMPFLGFRLVRSV